MIKRWLQAHPWRGAGIALLTVAFAAIFFSGRTPLYSPSYTPSTMTTISAQRTTHCMGRYLIDFPAGFSQTSGAWGDIELYSGLDKDFQRVYVTVASEPFTPERFANRIKAREIELRQTINSATNGPMLLHAEQIPGVNAVIFRRLEDPNYDGSVMTEVHQLVGQRYVHYQQVSHDEKGKLGYKTHRNVDPGPNEARLKAIAAKLKPESASGIGFCFQGVIFDVGQDDEVATFKFRDAEQLRDLTFRIDYHAVTGQPKESLAERSSDPPSMLREAGLYFLRKGTRQLGGMHAEEVLTKFQRPFVFHQFKAETRTDKQNFARPTMSMRMSTGQAVRVGDTEIQPEGPSSLSDDQALQLWDEVLKSVRQRPGALPVQMTSLGEGVAPCRFGQACPRNGYWMRQVQHPAYAYNAYYAQPHMHVPMLAGMVFVPDRLTDTPDMQPHTRWIWTRDIDPHGASQAALDEQARRKGGA